MKKVQFMSYKKKKEIKKRRKKRRKESKRKRKERKRKLKPRNGLLTFLPAEMYSKHIHTYICYTMDET